MPTMQELLAKMTPEARAKYEEMHNLEMSTWTTEKKLTWALDKFAESCAETARSGMLPDETLMQQQHNIEQARKIIKVLFENPGVSTASIITPIMFVCTIVSACALDSRQIAVLADTLARLEQTLGAMAFSRTITDHIQSTLEPQPPIN